LTFGLICKRVARIRHRTLTRGDISNIIRE
jgi:hypothetical protein